LSVYQRNASPAEADSFYALPEMKYMDPVSLASWDPRTYVMTMNRTEEEWEAVRKELPLLIKLTGALQKAGSRLLLGTDTPNPFLVPGFSIHTELQILTHAGLSPYEALKMGTYNAAECLGKLNEFGTIEKGKQTDMILLDENPLDDVANITKVAGVMVRGQWFTEIELQKKLEEIAGSYLPESNRFDGVPELANKKKPVQTGIYELAYNGVVFGEERYALNMLSAGNYNLSAQMISDRPYSTRTLIKMRLNSEYMCIKLDFENKTSTGQNILSFRRKKSSLEIDGTLEANEKVNRTTKILNSDMITSPRVTVCVSSVPSVSSLFPLIPKLLSMECGDSLKVRTLSQQLTYPYEPIEESLYITRKEDSENILNDEFIPMRVFDIDISGRNYFIPTRLITDHNGQIISWKIEQQIGILQIRLKD
jgi:hypothetical protein